MDLLSDVTELLKVVAWPCMAILAVALFAKKLKWLLEAIAKSIGRLKVARFKDVVAEFSSPQEAANYVVEESSKVALQGADLSRVAKEVSYSAYPFYGMSRVLAARTLSGSPFTVEKLIEDAHVHLFLAAQNHYYIASRCDHFKNCILSFLRAEKRRHVSTLLCSNDTGKARVSPAIEVWKFVTAAQYPEHLGAAVACFKSWQREADSDRDTVKRLVIKAAPSVPMSATFVDPDEERGYMVFVPNVYEARATVRPAYCISRLGSPEILQSYWQSYRHVFENSETVGILELPDSS